MKISLKEQVETLEGVVANHRSYVSVCERYVQQATFDPEVLADTKNRLPYMEACLATMQWLLKNENKIKMALRHIPTNTGEK
jgi:hypothetical protein